METLGPYELVAHRVAVPLDHGAGRAAADDARITIFAREVRRAGRTDLPWLCFLQGGPGFESPRPVDDSGWIGFATEYFRVLLVDQRGTGNSAPVDASRTCDAATLALLRLDSIVADCEVLRQRVAGGEPWSVLGQSYGGFCAVHYLSSRPDALERVYLTGGLPPIGASIEDVYRATFALMAERSREYHTRYPGDAAKLDAICDRLEADDVRLPNGDRLSVRRLQQVGMWLGQKRGIERLHWLVESAFAERVGGAPFTRRFLRGVENALSFDTHPLYAVLHEAIYSEGPATNWAADRVRAELPEFERRRGEPLLFTAESIHPWMFEEYGALRPMRDVAHELARREGWGALHDRAALAANTVPVAAAVYDRDLYVDLGLSLAAASAIGGCRVWRSATHEHDALREDGRTVLGALFREIGTA
ncbi:MAG: alpha/beta fold hydrolase [Planctomycetota bacterium]